MATTLNSTTLSGAITKTQTSLKVAAATYVVKDTILFIDGEFIRVLADPDGTFCPQVFRGYFGSVATAHNTGVVVWCNPASWYYDDDPTGAGTAATEVYLPHISGQSKSAFMLDVAGKWFRFIDRGLPVSIPGGAYNAYTTNATTALPVTGGTFKFTTGAATAFTMAVPGAMAPEGTVATFISGDASQPTVEFAAAVSGASNTKMTFAAAAGSAFSVMVIGGAWKLVWTNSVSAPTAGT